MTSRRKKRNLELKNSRGLSRETLSGKSSNINACFKVVCSPLLQCEEVFWTIENSFGAILGALSRDDNGNMRSNALFIISLKSPQQLDVFYSFIHSKQLDKETHSLSPESTKTEKSSAGTQHSHILSDRLIRAISQIKVPIIFMMGRGKIVLICYFLQTKMKCKFYEPKR